MILRSITGTIMRAAIPIAMVIECNGNDSKDCFFSKWNVHSTELESCAWNVHGIVSGKQIFEVFSAGSRGGSSPHTLEAVPKFNFYFKRGSPPGSARVGLPLRACLTTSPHPTQKLPLALALDLALVLSRSFDII